MLEHKCNYSAITTAAGQSVGRVLMQLDGVFVSVVPVSVAAARLAYSERYTRHLCDIGELIAVKIVDRWWVLERAIEIQPETAVLVPVE